MELINKNMKISEVTKKYPNTLNVFGNFKIDFCCGGGRTIEEACLKSKINLDELLSELNRVI
jgi:regulator of cell morphogenesis and NO signaling